MRARYNLNNARSTATRIGRLASALGGLALLNRAALAQSQTGVDVGQMTQQYMDSTPATDMSTMAFTALLGTFFTNPFAALGSASTLLGSMFLIFNTFVLVAGTIWATYGVGVAVVQTAHEGSLMGKKLSEIWLPIRMITGVASLIPAFGGFSLSQAVLVFATTVGIGAANMGYNSMIDGANNMTTLVSPSLVSPKAQGASSLKQAGFAIFRARVCMLAQNDYAADQQAATGTDQSAITINTTRPPGGVTGLQYGTPGNGAYCGGVSVTASNISARESSSAVGYRVASVNYDWIATQMQQKAVANFDTYANQISALADQWYQQYAAYQNTSGGTRPSIPVGQIEGIATTYYVKVQPDMAQASDGGKALSDAAIASMKQFGWFGAGAWSATLAEVNAAVAQAAQTVDFRTISPQVAAQDGGYNTQLASVLRVLDTAAQTAQTEQSNSSSSASGSPWQALCRLMANTVSMSPTAANTTGNCSLGQSFVMTLIDVSTSGAGGASSSNANGLRLIDPLVAMKNMGDYMMVTAEGLYTAYSYLSADSGSGSGVGGTLANIAGKAVSWVANASWLSALAAPLKQIAGILPLIIGAMFILGSIMAIWIPMIPFVTWWGGLVQYLTIFFEGIVAAPIWAFVHLDSSGEGMGQRTETGYLFIINMLFRPFLMLLGFVASLALMIVMGSFLFWLYPSVMSNVQGNSITGIFSVLGFLVVFWVLMHTLVQTLANLSVLLPDQALAWAGRAIGAQLGRDSENQARSNFMAFGRFGQQGMGQMTTGALGSRVAKGNRDGATQAGATRRDPAGMSNKD